jgi:MFS family permease
MVIATVLQTASQSVGMFIGARFLIGFGLTFAANAAPLLVTEIAYPPYRASLTSLYNSLWYSGNIVCVLVRPYQRAPPLTCMQCVLDHLRYL